MNDPIKLPYTSGRWYDLWEVQSESRKDVSYVVGKTVNGEWGCSCPRWTFHTPRTDCKHICHVKNVIASSMKVKEYTIHEVMAKPAIQKVVSRFSLIEI